MMSENKLKPCVKCIEICRILIAKTLTGNYRIGCTIHGEWQEEAYPTVEEAVAAWNRRDDEQEEADI